MKHLSIDIETYSSVDIKKAGLYRYAQSPDFEILLIGYVMGDGEEVYVLDMADPDEDMLEWLREALQDRDTVKHAYNASFEWCCLNRAGFYTPLNQWRCTMLHGLYCGYPAGLGAVGEAIGLPSDKRKLGVGLNLIRTFCCPVKPTKTNGGRTRTRPEHEPEKWELFKRYNAQDVITEREVARRLSAFPVPDREQTLWELDQQMNARGVCVDEMLVDGALKIGEAATARLMAEAKEISGLDNPKSVSQLTKWLGTEIDDEITDLRKDTVTALLEKGVSSERAERMLEIRQQLGKTSTKKFDAVQRAVCADERVRGLLQFYGANRTGRWAGRLVQVQNLPRNHMDTLDLARELVRTVRGESLQLCYGNVPDTLSQLVRTVFVPYPGNRLAVTDYSAIEARVIAWLAGEEWRQEVFRTTGKIYEASASQMFHVPAERIVKGNPEYALRQKGKVAELALGYQGGPGALIKMGALTSGLNEDELPEIVARWRAASPRIVTFWRDIENAAKQAIRLGGSVPLQHGIALRMEGDALRRYLTITLPSGRKLFYLEPALSENRFGNDSILYQGVDQKTKKWGQLETYGGKLVENVVQAVARDCLAELLLRLDSMRQTGVVSGDVVFHVHDEVILDTPDPEGDLAAALEAMAKPIPWADGLLLKGAGFIADYYQKD